MGIIDKNMINAILVGSCDKLRKLAQNINTLSIEEIYFLIIVLAQYLYAYCAYEGRLVGNSYEVVPSTLKSSAKLGTWGLYSRNVVKARNVICHSIGVPDSMRSVDLVANNRKQIIRFLKFLGVIEEPKFDPLAELMAASTAAAK